MPYQFYKKKYITIDQQLRPFQSHNKLSDAIKSIKDYDTPMAIVKYFKHGKLPKDFVYIHVPHGQALKRPLAKLVKGLKINKIIKQNKGDNTMKLSQLRRIIRTQIKKSLKQIQVKDLVFGNEYQLQDPGDLQWRSGWEYVGINRLDHPKTYVFRAEAAPVGDEFYYISFTEEQVKQHIRPQIK